MNAGWGISHLRLALHAKEHAQRLDRALQRLMAEDPTLVVHDRQPSGRVVIAGIHERHLEVILDRLKREFHVEAEVGRPQVAYREVLTRAAEGEMKYARFAGGRGHYAHVRLRVHPREHGSGYLFQNAVIGGAIPSQYMDGIDEAIRDTLNQGLLAGFPVDDVHVQVLDGSYHEVDSSEAAFRLAASLAVLDAARQAEPVLLEPVMRVRAIVAPEYVDDVIKNMHDRRGRLHLRRGVVGGDLVVGHVPLAELTGYDSDFRNRTRGRGTHEIQFEDHAPVGQRDDADDRDSFVTAPIKPAPKGRDAAVAVPEPHDDRPEEPDSAPWKRLPNPAESRDV